MNQQDKTALDHYLKKNNRNSSCNQFNVFSGFRQTSKYFLKQREIKKKNKNTTLYII